MLSGKLTVKISLQLEAIVIRDINEEAQRMLNTNKHGGGDKIKLGLCIGKALVQKTLEVVL